MTETTQIPDRVTATAAARELIDELEQAHGPLMFHQSGGCCDGSAPMCYPRGDLVVGRADVRLGALDDTPFYIGAKQYALWEHTQLIIDVVDGRGAGFSLEAPTGKRFITRSRVFDDAERAILAAHPAQLADD